MRKVSDSLGNLTVAKTSSSTVAQLSQITQIVIELAESLTY